MNDPHPEPDAEPDAAEDAAQGARDAEPDGAEDAAQGAQDAEPDGAESAAQGARDAEPDGAEDAAQDAEPDGAEDAAQSAQDAEPDGAEIWLTAFGRSDPGRVRDCNQDTLFIGDLYTGDSWPADQAVRIPVTGRGPLLIVCDGMGGAAGGEVASQMATQIIWDEMRAAQDTDRREIFARLLRRAVRAANQQVWERGRSDSALRGMGTTVSAAGVVDGALIAAQVGDSRIYVERAGELVLMTRDQTVWSALIRSGDIEPDQPKIGGMAHVVLQALGVREDIEVALSLVELRRGDRLLVCSDGVHGLIDDEALASVLTLRDDDGEASQLLVASALAAGGGDNITAIVARIDGAGLPACEPGGDDSGQGLRYLEFDPQEEGQAALSTTAVVARRLAARAGLGEEPDPPSVPMTIQHPVVRAGQTGRGGARHNRDIAGPAQSALAKSSRISPRAWVIAGILVLAAAAVVIIGIL
ncbi:MAG: protein phosphatase 2C domain-containing protein [Myxococcota bacterium]